MALRALHLSVQSGQRIARLRVIELADADGLPVFEVVALLAGLPQSSVVGILVAGRASRPQSQISPVQVFDLDGGAFLRTDARRRVTAIAGQARVFAQKRISSRLVVEGFDVPLNQREVLAIMFRVAARALLAGTGRDVVSRMQSLAGTEPRGNFRMAVQALQRRLPAAELVATGAVGRSIE